MTSLRPPLRLRLDAPLRTAAGTLQVRGTARVREAVRIRLHDGQGHVGLGEAMPLPGYSRDDAPTAERVLAAVAAQVAEAGLLVPDGPARTPAAAGARGTQPPSGADGTAGPPEAIHLEAALAPWAALLEASPAARFALECALVDLLSRRAGLSAAHWLASGHDLQAVPVSLLLPDDDDDAIAAARAAVAEGFTVLKLKIARSDRSAGQEDALLAALRTAVDAAAAGHDAQVLLRLDANGALDPAQAVDRLTALRRHGVELVEEPVAGAALLALPPLPLPWAADESLADPALATALFALPPGRRPAALVLKPAQLGLARCLHLAEAAARHGVGVIVTHSLDGDTGHAAACALASALPMPPWPCGLAPHPGLRHPSPARPWLPVPAAPGLGVPDWNEAA
jgi:L-alanine-DL-glutamate epimerase-like enolase superfamily enzyme